MERHDYAFPFRIALGSRQGERVGYEAHVKQMVLQVLLTSPGERADLPEFGCGLRAMIFAPNSDAVAATVQMLVQHALARWLSEHIVVRAVEVLPPGDGVEDNELVVRVEYALVATRAVDRVEARVT